MCAGYAGLSRPCEPARIQKEAATPCGADETHAPTPSGNRSEDLRGTAAVALPFGPRCDQHLMRVVTGQLARWEVSREQYDAEKRARSYCGADQSAANDWTGPMTGGGHEAEKRIDGRPPPYTAAIPRLLRRPSVYAAATLRF